MICKHCGQCRLVDGYCAICSRATTDPSYDTLLEENSRLNTQVRTLGEQVEDAKITIASLKQWKEGFELGCAERDAIIDGLKEENARLTKALEIATKALSHIVHGDPTKRHAQEWYTTATNSLAQIEKILGQK